MVRNYVKKADRGEYGNQKLAEALQAVSDGMPLIRASKEYSIPARTLRRHRDKKVQTPGSVNLGRHVPALPAEVEHELHEHIKSMEKSLYGLTVRDVQRLVFDVAEHSGVQHPFNREKKRAGKDWLRGFFARFRDLSV